MSKENGTLTADRLGEILKGNLTNVTLVGKLTDSFISSVHGVLVSTTDPHAKITLEEARIRYQSELVKLSLTDSEKSELEAAVKKSFPDISFAQDKATPALAKDKTSPVRIGITGTNLTDGMGDLAHMLNVGEALKREGVTDVRYYINWILLKNPHQKAKIHSEPDSQESADNPDYIRLNQLVDKLKYLGILPKDKEISGETTLEYIENINKAAAGKLHLGFVGAEHLRVAANQADLWLSVSAGKFDVVKKIPFLTQNFISILEHYSTKKESHQFCMDMVTGLPLQDQIVRTDEERASALEKIKNPRFQQLLTHGRDGSSPRDLIASSEFIPVYPQHLGSKENGSMLIAGTCCLAAKLSPEKEQFLVKLGGQYSLDSLISETRQAQLKKAGFTQIQYFKDGRIETIPLFKEPETAPPKKVLKLLDKCFLSEEENAAFTKIMGKINICSGDNTIQDAISCGSIPVFIPHMPEKAQVLSGCLRKVKKEGELYKFLEFYEQNAHLMNGEIHDNHQGGNFRFPLMSLLSSLNLTKLAEEWQELCKVLVKDHNLTTTLRKFVDTLADPKSVDYLPEGLLFRYLTDPKIEPSKIYQSDIRKPATPPRSEQPKTEEEILEAIRKKEKITSADGTELDPILYAVEHDITLEGLHPFAYAIKGNLQIDAGIDPVSIIAYAHQAGYFYEDPTKDGVKKSPLEYAIDNGIKIKTDLGEVEALQAAIDGSLDYITKAYINGEDPLIYAIKKGISFKKSVEGATDPVIYAVKKKKTLDKVEDEAFYQMQNDFEALKYTKPNKGTALIGYALITRTPEQNAELLAFAAQEKIQIGEQSVAEWYKAYLGKRGVEVASPAPVPAGAVQEAATRTPVASASSADVVPASASVSPQSSPVKVGEYVGLRAKELAAQIRGPISLAQLSGRATPPATPIASASSADPASQAASPTASSVPKAPPIPANVAAAAQAIGQGVSSSIVTTASSASSPSPLTPASTPKTPQKTEPGQSR